MHRNGSQVVVGLWLIKNAFVYKKIHTYTCTHIYKFTHTYTVVWLLWIEHFLCAQC